jgi:hypothetical protein
MHSPRPSRHKSATPAHRLARHDKHSPPGKRFPGGPSTGSKESPRNLDQHLPKDWLTTCTPAIVTVTLPPSDRDCHSPSRGNSPGRADAQTGLSNGTRWDGDRKRKTVLAKTEGQINNAIRPRLRALSPSRANAAVSDLDSARALDKALLKADLADDMIPPRLETQPGEAGGERSPLAGHRQHLPGQPQTWDHAEQSAKKTLKRLQIAPGTRPSDCHWLPASFACLLA